MDGKWLLENFEIIAEAPGGVGKIRDFATRFALEGRLVPPEPDGLSGGERIDRIRRAKKSIVQSGETKKRSSSPVSPEEGLFPIPEHWGWCRLTDVTRDFGQRIPDRTFTYIDVGSIDNEKGRLSEVMPCLEPSDAPSRARKQVRQGTVIYSTIRPYLLNVAIIDYAIVPEPIASTAFAVLHPLKGLEARFLRYYLRSAAFTSHVKSEMAGVAYPAINDAKLYRSPVPLPPLGEQRRIVAKVDELMALCDELEKRQKRRHRVRKSLQTSALDALTSAETPEEVETAWRRAKENWGTLTNHPDFVHPIRQAIRGLACSGRLTSPSQRSTGAELLAEIEAARREWASRQEGQMRREADAALKKLAKQEINPPFQLLPETWCWASLLQVCQVLVDCHNKTAPYSVSGIPIIRTSNVRNGTLSIDDAKRVSQKTYDFWSRRCPPRPGDIIFTREAPMGEAAIIPNAQTVCLGQRTMLLRVFPELVDPRFLLLALLEPGFQYRMTHGAVGSTVKHLRVGDVESLVVPLAPRDEQRRILSRVDELMLLCDTFEETARKQVSTSEHLAKIATLAA